MKLSASSADFKVRREAALVADVGVVAGVLQVLLQRMEDLRAHADGLGGAVGADRHDHELLDVDRVVGVRAAVDDVHHRHRQHVRGRPAEVAVERQAGGRRRRLGHGQADAENGVGAEPALVLRAVELHQRGVDAALVLRVHPRQRIEDLPVDRVHGLGHALAEVAALVAVAQLDRLVRAGRGARRHRRAALRAVLEHHVHLDRRVAAAIQDLAADDVDDGGHGDCLLRAGCGRGPRVLGWGRF